MNFLSATTRRIAAHAWVGNAEFASSGLCSKPSTMYTHGLDERLPVRSFYEGREHVYRLAVDLGEAKPAH